MGVVLKSVFGLGAVYYAMFAPAVNPADLTATARLCGEAAQAQAQPSEILRSQFALAHCIAAISAPPAPRVALIAAPPPRAPVRAQSGSLTQADLSEPWYGPTERSRKARPPG